MGSAIGFLIPLAIAILIIAGVWKVFTKAGQPGWGSLIPIYNLYLWTIIAKRPAWWILLMFVPVVNLVISIILCIDIAKYFGKGTGYGIGILFLGIIFLPMLGFGDAEYIGNE